MATDLRQFPGADRRARPPLGRARPRPRTGRSRGERGAPPGRREPWNRRPPWVAPRSRILRRRRPVPWTTLGLGLMFTLIGGYLFHAFWQATRVDVAVDGLEGSGVVSSATWADRTVRFTIGEPDRADRATLLVDRQPVDDGLLSVEGDTIAWEARGLAEGAHEISLAVPRPILGDAAFSWWLTVDDTPPVLDVASLQPARGICEPVRIEGSVEAGAALTIGDEAVEVDGGRFRLDYDRPPEAMTMVATDAAGNRTESEVIVPVAYPGGQGVHVTAIAWGYEPLRRGVLDLIDAGLVSVVELDLKDEGGVVGYDSSLALANEVGAVEPSYDLADTVAELEGRGVRVVGRIVAFRDPKLGDWAWANGHRDWVVQEPDGSPHLDFVNVASPEVQQYNLDVALEAADAGIDDILWDYVRRPEGDLDDLVFTGMVGTPSDTVVGFLDKTQEALRARCVYQGASVFGIAADRPDAVGQDVPRLARNVEYLAPMLYPSHWVPGEYRVPDPNRQPGQIVTAALADFQAKTAGTGIALTPWLQDFSDGVAYGPGEVRAQIEAARGLGVDDWLLWNAGVVYTPGALDPSLVSMDRSVLPPEGR